MESMFDYIKNYPKLMQDAIELTRVASLQIYDSKDFNKIIVCGMGGSAVGGDIIKDLMKDKDFLKDSELRRCTVEVSREYRPPAYADNKTLVFCVSYSGDTEETLNQFVELRKRGCKMISITSGGRLKKWSERLDIPFVELPGGFKPRAAIPYLFIPILVYLSNYGIEPDFNEAIKTLEDRVCTVENSNKIREIADVVRGHPINVYGPADFEAVVRRAKNQFNENSKLPAAWAVFPELSHNEIVGYEDNDLNKEVYVLILRDSEEDESMKAKIDATKEIIRPKVKGVVEIYSEGKSKLARMMSLFYRVDLLSYYLAVSEGKIPEKNDFIDRLKSVLAEKVGLANKLESELV
jgi:glucose/mannose-6-phosphate isomerase